MDLLDQISADFAATLEQPTEGKQAEPVTCTIVRPLLPEDLAKYLDEHGKLTTTQNLRDRDIKVLREKHHSVARLLAEGVPDSVVAVMAGYTPEYISILKNNPSMVQLIEHYRLPSNEAAKHIGENLRRVAGMAWERIEERIAKDELNSNELLAATKLGYDRSGHGPASSIHEVREHHIIDHAEIARRHAEARKRDQDLIVHPEDVRKALPAPEVRP